MKHRRPSAAPGVSLGDRFVAALLTPLFFNAAVIITVAFFSKRTYYLLIGLNDVYQALGSGAVLLLVAPAVVGFVAGIDGTAQVFGHAFWTHHENERSLLATALIWALFAAAVVYVNTRVAG